MLSFNNLPLYCQNLFNYKRHQSSMVMVGQVGIGGDNAIRLQSMTTTNTLDATETALQAQRIFKEGGELVRITTQGRREAQNLELIKSILKSNGYLGPLVADIHFNPNAAEIAASLIEKVRINPGNFVSGAKKFREHDTSDAAWQEGIEAINEKFIPFLDICKSHGTAIRIGVNHGSLSDRIMSRYGDTPQGMVESCMEYLRICKDQNFDNVVLSIKASNTRIMVHTVRLLVATMATEDMSYPLHLGVTEAGNGEDGRIKSAVGIGALLADGIGDTIRVSLTEDPENEIPVARKLVDHFQKRLNHTPIEIIDPFEFSPYAYSKLKTSAINNIGGNNTPIVIQQVNSIKSPILDNPSGADIIYTENIDVANWLVATKKQTLVPYPMLKQLGVTTKCSPLITSEEIKSFPTEEKGFILLTINNLTSDILDQLKTHPSLIIIGRSLHVNPLAEMRAFIWRLHSNGITNPVIIQREYNTNSAEDLQIEIGADIGALFLDGLLDGTFILNEQIDANILLSAQFGLLQASRVRFSKTEFISCPGCGRTLFALQKITEEIKARTSHLKGLKIGIMGCIVNGIGEMADADYGYIGSGVDRVSLFKQKEMMQRNLPTDEALEALISLIKENGDWVEP